jgi:hypothetical protein
MEIVSGRFVRHIKQATEFCFLSVMEQASAHRSSQRNTQYGKLRRGLFPGLDRALTEVLPAVCPLGCDDDPAFYNLPLRCVEVVCEYSGSDML